jgi:hypothetical protein
VSALVTVLASWALSAPPTVAPSAVASPWAVLSDQLSRGDLVAARAFAETVASERALRGQAESPLEVGLVLDMLPATKPDRREALLGVAEALSPGDVRIPAAHMLVSDATDALTAALPKALRAFAADPVARSELEARLAMALLLALITTLVVVLFGVAMTRARLLAHDLGSWLPPRLRTGGLPLAIVSTLVVLPGGLGLGLVGAALIGLVLHSFHLRLGERVACLVLAVAAAFSGDLVRRALTPVSVSDDASRCLAGGCDPAGLARLHLASRADTDFARSRVALALLALREEPPNLSMADVFLAAVPQGDPNRLVGETQLALHQLRDRCTMYGGKAPPEAPERLSALEKALLARPEAVTLVAASVTAGLRGQLELARAHRERALAADPHRVSQFLAQLPSHRPGRANVELATDLCAPLFRPQVEVPVFGLPPVTVSRAPPLWFRLSGADRPGIVRVLAWIAIVGLLLPLLRRYRVAYACDVCGAPASVRRNPELHGLTECERCLFARVVVATPNRDASGASRDEHRHSPLQLATLVVPGLGGILVGRLMTGGFGLLFFLVGVFLQPWSTGPSPLEDGASVSVAAVLARVGLWLSLTVWALLLALESRRPPRPASSGSAERAS